MRVAILSDLRECKYYALCRKGSEISSNRMKRLIYANDES